MNDNDKTVRNDSVPPMSSGTQEQGGRLLQTGMMQPPQMPGVLGQLASTRSSASWARAAWARCCSPASR